MVKYLGYPIYPKYWDTLSTYHTFLKFEIVHSTIIALFAIHTAIFRHINRCYLLMCLNIAVCMANSVDPDQMPYSTATNLILHCLQRPICPST